MIVPHYHVSCALYVFLFIPSKAPVCLSRPRTSEPRRDNCLGASRFIYSMPPRYRHNTLVLSAFDEMEPRASRPLAMANPIYRHRTLSRWDLDVQDFHGLCYEPHWIT